MLFVNVYITEHTCEKPGCGNVLVLDGNMKNHRYVCAATHAGYAEFKGKIRTGCPKTPAHKSSYCSVHTPCVDVCHEPLECDKASGTNESVEQPVGLNE